MSRYSPSPRLPLIVFVSILLCTFSIGQAPSPSASGGSVGDDIFFLDLGIVIEPITGHENVNRLIKAPPEHVKFFLDKEPSGSVFMASTKELKETLRRISERIGALEEAFRRDVATLREENEELREMVADLLARGPILRPEPPPAASSEGTSEEMDSAGEGFLTVPGIGSTVVRDEEEEASEDVTDPEGFVEPQGMEPVALSATGWPHHEVAAPAIEKVAVKEPTFSKMRYMNAVFAYEREDYRTALRLFSRLYLERIDQVTGGNVVYWIADCHYQLGQYLEALETLEGIKPLFDSDKQDDAMVLAGLVYRQMGDETQALEAFTTIVDRYPNSEYFRLAELELRKLLR